MKPYESYKEVDLPWLAEIPEHWKIVKINELFDERATKVSDKDFAPLSVSKQGILPQLASAVKTDNGDNRKLVRKGDFVINSRSDRKGASGISPFDGSVSLINIVLKPRKGIFDEFFHYLLRCNSFKEEYYRNGRGIVSDLWTTRYSEMRTIPLPIPPLSEQNQIVKYLDYNFYKIDKFLTEKKKQVALLKEYKQGAINQVVTKGLDPNAKMKDSGTEWLGEIPEDWEVVKLSQIAHIILSGMDKKIYEGQQPIIQCNYVDVYRNNFITDSMAFLNTTATSLEINNYTLYKGDLIITKDSESWQDIGVPSYVKEPLTNVCCGYHLAIIRGFFENLNSQILLYAFQSNYVQFQHKIKAKGVTRFGLGYQPIHDTRIALPNIDEQNEIVAFLEAVTAKIDANIDSVEQEIHLMEEYRNRLISDVVTGKMDVRNIEIPQYDIEELEFEEVITDIFEDEESEEIVD